MSTAPDAVAVTEPLMDSQLSEQMDLIGHLRRLELRRSICLVIASLSCQKTSLPSEREGNEKQKWLEIVPESS